MSKDEAQVVSEYEKTISDLKVNVSQLDMKLKNITFSKELLEKEFEKK